MKNRLIYAVLAVLGSIGLASCDGGVSEVLAPYEGQRPFELLKITQSYAPDVQWVGGRVAAVGVNRGSRAALDSTLLWVRTAPGEDISSHVTIGEEGDAAFVRQYGGTPVDSLPTDVPLTFWMADRAVLEGGLDSTTFTAESFLDTTFASFSYEIRGRLRTREDVEVSVYRDQKLLSDRLIVQWTPADFNFRQIALRKASSPGFADLIWHVVAPDGQPGLKAPFASNQVPAQAEVVVPWPEEGISPESYTLWMTAPNWNSTFTLTAPGLAYVTFFTNSIQP